MKGKIVSRTLAEAGLTPREGMQMYWKGHLWRIVSPVMGAYVVCENLIVGDQTAISKVELRTLLVEYPKYHPVGTCAGVHGDFHYPEALPLKHSDWQTAIDRGLVDSREEIDFKVEKTVWYGIQQELVPEYEVAALISQQDDVETLAKRDALDHTRDDAPGWLYEVIEEAYKRGYKAKAAKSSQQQNEAELGVGDGTGQHIVRGSYETIKLLQDKLFKMEAMEATILELGRILEELIDNT